MPPVDSCPHQMPKQQPWASSLGLKWHLALGLGVFTADPWTSAESPVEQTQPLLAGTPCSPGPFLAKPSLRLARHPSAPIGFFPRARLGLGKTALGTRAYHKLLWTLVHSGLCFGHTHSRQ